MFSKINIYVIVRDHLSTLHGYGSTRLSIRDLIVFFALPIGIGWTLVYCLGIRLKGDLVSNLITGLSIFVGLLLNLQVIIFDIISKLNESIETNTEAETAKDSVREVKRTMKRAFIKEIFSNTSFAILLSIVTLLPLVTLLFEECKGWSAVLSAVSFSLILMFLMNLLMILKRMHLLLGHELRSKLDP